MESLPTGDATVLGFYGIEFFWYSIDDVDNSSNYIGEILLRVSSSKFGLWKR